MSEQKEIMSMEQYHEQWDQNVILDHCHPNLDVSKRKTCDDDETEDNMVVIVDYRDKRYRVDFEREGPELKLMPRHLKKMVALEDIAKTVDKEEAAKAAEERAALELKKSNPVYANAIKQCERKGNMIDRLRAKLLKKNPLRKDVKGIL